MAEYNFIEQKFGSYSAMKVEEILDSIDKTWKDVSNPQAVELASLILDVIEDTEEGLVL